MKKLITLLIVLAIAAGAFFAFQRVNAQRQAAARESLQTVRAETGSLTATVGATGTVRANQTAILTWKTSGTVESIDVAPGEAVEAGQFVASLAKGSLPQNVILAQADLAEAQKALDNLLEPATELELKEAEQAITLAQQQVRDAERRASGLQTSSSQADIDQARSNVVLARSRLDRAREDFAPYENKPEDNLIRANLQSRLAQAQKDYDAAVQRLNNLLGGANALDVELATADLAVAEARLEDAKELYEQLKAGADAVDIASAEARIVAFQAILDQQYVEAPFNGVITQIENKPGDQVTPGTPAFRLDDLSRILLDVRVSEVDINRIQIGQPAVLTFDAILAKEYYGSVVDVSLVGDISQGVVEFTVTVEVSDADEAVRPGMTAAVNMIISQLDDVLLVPNRAVRVQEGKRVVYVLRAEQPEAVEIELGASSDLESQVVSGDLAVGDLIVLNPPSAFEQGGPPFMQR